MDWKKLYFGKMNKKKVDEYVKDEEWQKVRIDMKGKSLEYKYNSLMKWLEAHNCEKRRVQVTNYVTALSRGGLINVSDYREV